MSTLLIIGAKSDMAKAAARKFAENGYDLILAARNSKELDAFANDINIRTQRQAAVVEVDALAYKTHQKFYESLPQKPDGVLAAVGYLGDQPKAQTDFAEAHKIIDSNYTGVVSLLNIVANDFESRNGGFIVGISSVAGDRGRQSNYLYGSAKAAFTAYLSGLRNRLAAANVQVLTVKPGFVDTAMTEGLDLPEKLTAQPQTVADDIFKAVKKGRNVIYTKYIWRWVMLVIKSIPEFIFKKLSL